VGHIITKKGPKLEENEVPEWKKKLEKDLSNGEDDFAYIPVNFIQEKLVNYGDKKNGMNIYGTRYELTKNYILNILVL